MKEQKFTGLRKLVRKQLTLAQNILQLHPISNEGINSSDFTKENVKWAVFQATITDQDLKIYDKIMSMLPNSSKLIFRPTDAYGAIDLNERYKNNKNIVVDKEEKMSYDIPLGNPIFYKKSKKTTDSRTARSLVYDKHIKDAVENKSGKQSTHGPFTTDHSWFLGARSHKTFREWVFGPVFGLKTLIIEDPNGYNIDGDHTNICSFSGEVGYNGDISVINKVTGKEFSISRKEGIIVINQKLASILPEIKTEKEYFWDRTKIELKLNGNNIINGPKEVKGGSVRVLKRLLLNQEPEYYYTDPEYITDWDDSDTERVATRYQPNTQKSDGHGGRSWYKIAVGTVVPPGTIIPGGLWFAYTVVEPGTGELHLKHLMSDEVTNILRVSRTGKSLHQAQTQLVPYATAFNGFTKEQTKILNEL